MSGRAVYETGRCRRIVSVGAVLIVALLHAFRVGAHLDGAAFVLYYSYFSDIVVPMAMYFLMVLNDATIPALRDWRIKALIVFCVASLTELAQAFGVPLLGRTFDPLDFLMFAVGVALGAALDVLLLPRLLPCWAPVVAAGKSGASAPWVDAPGR